MKEIIRQLKVSGEQPGAGTGAWFNKDGELLNVISPINGETIGRIRMADQSDYEKVVKKANEAFHLWRNVPAPKRGDLVRRIGNALRSEKKALGAMVSIETGKIRAEGEGEIQEAIDMADFAVGQSRMLYGFTMHSERPRHRMYEQWHPLGIVGVITAFNFPVAVWAWNAMNAIVAGDTVIWKPSSKAPLTAVAVMKIIWRVLQKDQLPEGILNLVIGKRDVVGESLIWDRRVPLISATGSVRMGRHIAEAVGSRLGKSILELGGNNAVIVTPAANLDLAVPAIVFGAVGTAGQRCTSTRRVIVHEKIYKTLSDKLIRAYRQINIGNPLEEGMMMGPLIDRYAVKGMQAALETLRIQGGRVLYGGEMLSGNRPAGGNYVTPCICKAKAHFPVTHNETFAPILYLIPYRTMEEAIVAHNAVPQGLSSSIFTQDVREAETFLSHMGSDCGIANVNIGTSGAEIGGAFGGEKDSGWGREAGSDAWKSYMRRQTCTVNWSVDLPLAQGIAFGD